MLTNLSPLSGPKENSLFLSSSNLPSFCNKKGLNQDIHVYCVSNSSHTRSTPILLQQQRSISANNWEYCSLQLHHTILLVEIFVRLRSYIDAYNTEAMFLLPWRQTRTYRIVQDKQFTNLDIGNKSVIQILLKEKGKN